MREACDRQKAEAQLRYFHPDAAILDSSLPNGDCSQLLLKMKAVNPAAPIVFLTGRSGSKNYVPATQPGTEHVLAKPVDLAALHALLRRLLDDGREVRPTASHAKTKRDALDPFVGTSSAIRRLRDMAMRVVESESPILLQGETGAGKGVLANWIHRNGPRAGQPFLDLNCAGLSRELLESELFGYEKGAFTSAVSAKPGLLEVANRGTVFLDEIGDIDLQVQPKLLKVLEDRTFRRLGDVRDRTVDIRLISATHRELLELVHQQRFRSDLYFRVNIIYIRVPPLRERVEDIAPLAEAMLDSLADYCGRPAVTMTQAALAALQQYSWPGNIRELRNVLERAMLVAQGNLLRPEDLHFQLSLLAKPAGASEPSGTLKEMECAYIHHVLKDERGSIERAARRLGIPRSSLYNKMRRFEIPQGTGRL